LELSAAKHLATKTSLSLVNNDLSRINSELDELIWEDAFKPYGYIGGLGVAYVFSF